MEFRDKEPNELIFRCKVYDGKDAQGKRLLLDVGMGYFSRARYRDANGVWNNELWDLVTLDNNDQRVYLAERVLDADIPRIRWNQMISPAIVKKRKDGTTNVYMYVRRNRRMEDYYNRVQVTPATEEE